MCPLNYASLVSPGSGFLSMLLFFFSTVCFSLTLRSQDFFFKHRPSFFLVPSNASLDSGRS